jgi:hypothetical protein
VRATAFLVAICAVVLAGCGGGSMEEVSPPPSETTPSADTGNRPPAPPVEGVSLEGERISLADYRGRAVFVNVWSSW